MGQEQHQFTNDKPMQGSSQKIIPAEYQICYQKWLADPDYLQKLMNENRALTANILDFFPNARASYDDFLQMIFYLRRYDPTIERNEYAKYNANHTTLLDRFFMLILKLSKYEQLQAIVINKDQMENLFIELMRLFITDPKKGFIVKLSKFIGLKQINETTLKQYSANLREFLPHIQKHLKDYYTSKFKNMQVDGHLLKHFNSQILYEDAVLLSMKVQQLTSPQITLLYQPRSCGTSFSSLAKNIIGYTGPWLLVIEHLQKDKNGQKQIFRLGSYQSGPIRDVSGFQGDFRGFLYQTQPKIRLYSSDKGTGGNFFYFINNIDDKSGKLRKGIGFGGNEHKQKVKLWLDQDIDKSTVFNGPDPTYGFGSVVTPSTTNLNITRIQIWGLGNQQDIKNQQQYWYSRNVQIQKRRKVNKAQFLQGDMTMMFGNTFAHRDQVYGVIQRGQNKQQRQQSQKRAQDTRNQGQQGVYSPNPIQQNTNQQLYGQQMYGQQQYGQTNTTTQPQYGQTNTQQQYGQTNTAQQYGQTNTQQQQYGNTQQYGNQQQYTQQQQYGQTQYGQSTQQQQGVNKPTLYNLPTAQKQQAQQQQYGQTSPTTLTNTNSPTRTQQPQPQQGGLFVSSRSTTSPTQISPTRKTQEQGGLFVSSTHRAGGYGSGVGLSQQQQQAQSPTTIQNTQGYGQQGNYNQSSPSTTTQGADGRQYARVYGQQTNQQQTQQTTQVGYNQQGYTQGYTQQGYTQGYPTQTNQQGGSYTNQGNQQWSSQNR